MSRAVLQIPLDVTLRNAATQVAIQEGFSSLQEAVRLFLTKFANKSITVSFGSQERLSPTAARRYARMIEDIRSGKVKTKKFDNVAAMMDYLNG